MHRLLFSLVLILGWASLVGAQVNPCTQPSPLGTVLGPTVLYARLPDHATTITPAGAPVTEFYEAAYFANGTVDANTATPVQGPSTIPKTAFVIAPGTTDCYKLTGMPAPIPDPGGPFVAAIRGRRTATEPATGTGDWSSVSNPFDTPPASAPKPVVGRVLVVKIP